MANPHARAEEWSLVYHRAIAERLCRRPDAVLGKARDNLAKLVARDGGGARRYLDRWDALLNGPRDALLAVLTGEGQEARDLRQCTPFAGVLAPAERWRLFRAWRGERAKQHATR